MSFFTQTQVVAILVLLPILSLAIDAVYEYYLEGRPPRLIPKLILFSFLQGFVVLVNFSLNVSSHHDSKDASGLTAAWILLLVLLQVALLIFITIIVRSAKAKTTEQIENHLKNIHAVAKADIKQSMVIQHLQQALVQEDLNPGFWLTRIFGDSNASNRKLFLETLSIMQGDKREISAAELEGLILATESRVPMERYYQIVGLVAFGSFLALVILSI